MGFNLREAVITYRKGSRVDASRRIASSRTVYEIIEAAPTDGLGMLLHGMTERFVVLSLDAKNRVIGWTLVGVGGVSACQVDPASAFRAILASGANAWIAVHNHPSGEVTPSAEDVALTERLARGAALIGLPMLDHVIVAEGGAYFSFLDAGLIGEE